MLPRMRSTGKTPPLLTREQNYTVLWKSIWQFLKKLGIDLPHDVTIILLHIYLEDTPSYHKDTCSTVFIAALFIIARNRKQPRCPSMEEWIKKIWYIYTMGYYSAVKN